MREDLEFLEMSNEGFRRSVKKEDIGLNERSTDKNIGKKFN
ncbi:MAG: hypothetical protein PWP31_1536 [Clostridia bacterium]|nr:hypothetical protein [Clostridia bacterium]